MGFLPGQVKRQRPGSYYYHALLCRSAMCAGRVLLLVSGDSR